MKYQGHEVEIIEWAGRLARVKRVDGGKLKIVSQLRHHRGRPAVEINDWLVCPTNIEGFIEWATAQPPDRDTTPTFSEKVAHYEKVMTSPTAKFELPS